MTARPIANEAKALLAWAVADARRRANLTQQHVADHLGWRRETVTEVEAGRRSIRAEELPELVECLGRDLTVYLRPAPLLGASIADRPCPVCQRSP